MGKRSAAKVHTGSPKRSVSPRTAKKLKEDFTPSPIPSDVQQVYDQYEPKHKRVLLELRRLIFETAKQDGRIGALEETLKWNEPAFLTTTTKSGSTLRIGYSKLSRTPALFVSCSTPLLQRLKQMDTSYQLDYFGLRDIAVPEITETNKKMLQTCILKTLTYHLDKKKKKTTS